MALAQDMISKKWKIERECVKIYFFLNLTKQIRKTTVKEIMIPTKINPKKAKSSYKNGVLKITLPKIQEKKKATGENISIEQKSGNFVFPKSLILKLKSLKWINNKWKNLKK